VLERVPSIEIFPFCVGENPAGDSEFAGDHSPGIPQVGGEDWRFEASEKAWPDGSQALQDYKVVNREWSERFSPFYAASVDSPNRYCQDYAFF